MGTSIARVGAREKPLRCKEIQWRLTARESCASPRRDYRPLKCKKDVASNGD